MSKMLIITILSFGLMTGCSDTGSDKECSEGFYIVEDDRVYGDKFGGILTDSLFSEADRCGECHNIVKLSWFDKKE